MTAMVFAASECRYRIEVKGLERHAQVTIGKVDFGFQASEIQRGKDVKLLRALKEKRARNLNPQYYACVDIEAFLWEGIDDDFELVAFAKRESKDLLSRFRSAVAAAKTGGKP
jgi:hypothetical protein